MLVLSEKELACGCSLASQTNNIYSHHATYREGINMRQLSIPKDAPLHLMRMSEDNLVLHKVHNPKMWVFTKEFGSVFEWPKQLEHNKQTYHYVSNEVMPRMVASQYG